MIAIAEYKESESELAARKFPAVELAGVGKQFGTKVVLGIDPGQRTGCKCAVVDDTGKLLEHQTFYLVQGAEATERAV